MKKNLMVLCLFFAMNGYSQTKAGITGHNHLGLQVADLQVSAKFYGDILGLERIEVPENLKAIGAWFKIGDIIPFRLIIS